MDAEMIKYTNGMPFVPVTFPPNEADGLLVTDLHTQELIDYLNCHDVKSAYVCNLGSYDLLDQCKNLEHIALELKTLPKYYGRLERKGVKYVNRYDIRSIYSLSKLKSIWVTDLEEPHIVSELEIHLDRFPKLEQYIGHFRYARGLGDAVKLKSLMISGYDKEDFGNLSDLKYLDTLSVASSKIRTLSGLEGFGNIQYLSLSYNRSLTDISALNTARSLRALRIENCGKIEDFSVLEGLSELRLLEISGRNELPSIGFIRQMKSLKTLILGADVLDGDLSPCLELQYAYCSKSRRNYNLKDKDLPKGDFVHGTEEMTVWRRLE